MRIGPGRRVAALAAASVVAASAGLPSRALGAPGWRRIDTARCRVHHGPATARVAARAAALCDALAHAIDPPPGSPQTSPVAPSAGPGGARRFDVVVLAPGEPPPEPLAAVAAVPGNPDDDRIRGGAPTLRRDLARALALAAVRDDARGLRVEVSAVARDPFDGVDTGAALLLGAGAPDDVRQAGLAELRLEATGEGGWTTSRDMVLRAAVLGDGAPAAAWEECRTYSLLRFARERRRAGETAGESPFGDDVVARWRARAEAVLSDRAERDAEAGGGAPPAPGDWPRVPAAVDADRLRASPDGRWLAWTEGGRAVLGRSPPDGVHGPPDPVPAEAGFDLAPDAASLVVATSACLALDAACVIGAQAPGPDLFVLPVGGGPARRLSRGLAAHEPAWAPDGTAVAFVRRADGGSRLGLLDPARPAAGVTWILDRPDEWIGRPRWSADGRWLAFDIQGGDRRDLWAVGRGGGDLRPLTWDDAAERDPAVDPRGRAVLYASDRTGAWEIHRLDLDTGRVERLTAATTGAFAPLPLPDGRVAYLEFGAAGFALRVLDKPQAIERIPTLRPPPVVIARTALPADPVPAPAGAGRGPGVLPWGIHPVAAWDAGLLGGLRLRVPLAGGGGGSALALAGERVVAEAGFDLARPPGPFLAARWVSAGPPVRAAATPGGDPVAPDARATSDGASGSGSWIGIEAGAASLIGGPAPLGVWAEARRTIADPALGAGGAEVRRLGLVWGVRDLTLRDVRLELRHGVYATDLDRAVWDQVEAVGAPPAAGVAYDHAYQELRAHVEWAPAPPLPVLRLRGGWIGRNVSAEEELFAGRRLPAERLRPLRERLSLAAYDEAAVHGETLLLLGASWPVPSTAGWRGSAGRWSAALDGVDLFANVGNAWGYVARWARDPGGAVLLRPAVGPGATGVPAALAGRPVAVPGSVRRAIPLSDPGAGGRTLLAEAGVEARLRLAAGDLLPASLALGLTARLAWAFQDIRGVGDLDRDGALSDLWPADPFRDERAPAGLRAAILLGTPAPLRGGVLDPPGVDR